MTQSIQLLHKALALNANKAFWCEQLALGRNTLSQAQTRERLSPTVAGGLARLLGEDISFWVTVAALESEPDTYTKRKLQSLEDHWRRL